MPNHVAVHMPHVDGPDSTVRLVEWLVDDGAAVDKDDELALLETSKSTWTLTSPSSGFLFHLSQAGDDLRQGAVVAVVADRAERPATEDTPSSPGGAGPSSLVVTEPARRVLEKHGLTAEQCASPSLAVLRAKDIQAYLAARTPEAPSGSRRFAGEPLDPNEPWDDVLQSGEYQQISAMLHGLRRRMKARFNRHVATGELLHDRWEMARNQGFGTGSSVYDACLLLGDVIVGENCWIGPFTVLDGAHAPLSIGDFSSIGSGSQVYTHNTIQNVLTGGVQPATVAPTTIGRCCFISPACVIGAGTRLGDHCFVAAQSYVEGQFDEGSYIAGNPARQVGTVELRNGRAILRRQK